CARGASGGTIRHSASLGRLPPIALGCRTGIAGIPECPSCRLTFRSGAEKGEHVRVMVTGGAGFIGSALVRYLVHDKGLSVLNVDKLTYAACLASLEAVAGSTRYRFLQVDISNAAEMNAAFAEFAPDAVVHL